MKKGKAFVDKHFSTLKIKDWNRVKLLPVRATRKQEFT